MYRKRTLLCHQQDVATAGPQLSSQLYFTSRMYWLPTCTALAPLKGYTGCQPTAQLLFSPVPVLTCHSILYRQDVLLSTFDPMLSSPAECTGRELAHLLSSSVGYCNCKSTAQQSSPTGCTDCQPAHFLSPLAGCTDNQQAAQPSSPAKRTDHQLTRASTSRMCCPPAYTSHVSAGRTYWEPAWSTAVFTSKMYCTAIPRVSCLH